MFSLSKMDLAHESFVQLILGIYKTEFEDITMKASSGRVWMAVSPIAENISLRNNIMKST
jgi:hypothetical protein